MGGFKGTDSEEWKVGAAARRDERAVHGEIRPSKHTNKKDTKRWCGGKVGREHDLKVGNYTEIKGWGYRSYEHWKVRYCARCGREVDHYIPPRGPEHKVKTPEWLHE